MGKVAVAVAAEEGAPGVWRAHDDPAAGLKSSRDRVEEAQHSGLVEVLEHVDGDDRVEARAGPQEVEGIGPADTREPVRVCLGYLLRAGVDTHDVSVTLALQEGHQMPGPAVKPGRKLVHPVLGSPVSDPNPEAIATFSFLA